MIEKVDTGIEIPKTAFVTPKTFLIGYTTIDAEAVNNYLAAVGATSFVDEMNQAAAAGLGDAEVLCSLYAKLCYASLTTGRNSNISSTRSIPDNVAATLSHGHGSVFEHVNLNFVTTDCSRVFTHEMVRHRVGTAFSQQSGRYVRAEQLRFVRDPLLEEIEEDLEQYLQLIQGLYENLEMRFGLKTPDAEYIKSRRYYAPAVKDMVAKKKLTSALRRLLPEGRANEIGWSINIRALRHTLMLRTSRHAEREIRLVFNQVWEIVSKKWPLLFSDAKTEMVDGLLEVTGMIMQPYEIAQH